MVLIYQTVAVLDIAGLGLPPHHRCTGGELGTRLPHHNGTLYAVKISRRIQYEVQMASLEFLIHIKSFRSHYGPGVDSAYNRNKYQEYFLGVKAAGENIWT